MRSGILGLMSINFPKLIFSIGLCLGAGIVGSIFTVSSPPAGGLTWYAALQKPAFSPPNWIFGPVWTILYIMMGVSLYLVQSSKLKIKSYKKKALTIFGVQLALNVLWSIVFFGLKNPTLALVDIIALWVMIFLTMRAFLRINKISGWLLVPYLVWVSFATYLNYGIWALNK